MPTERELNVPDPGATSVASELLIRQLEKILASEQFRNSTRLTQFLRYVVEQSLNPAADGLSEQRLGVEVFDRNEGYDTRSDPVVRVGARQLRFKLAEYYAGPGQADGVVIQIPKGGYAPRFQMRSPGVGGETHKNRRKPLGRTVFALASLCGIAILGLWASRAISRWAISSRALGVALDSIGHSRRAANPEARDLYLRGRYYWNKRNPEGLTKAVDYFTQSIVRDPTYAPAYAGLADTYNLLPEFTTMPSSEASARAIVAAKKAVELDDTLSEAHGSLAFASFWGAWDITTAGREFRRALALNPAYATAHHWYATYLLELGHFGEALYEIERAQQLDPTSTALLADKGVVLYAAGRPVDAISLLKQIETTDPAFLSPHNYLAEIYLDKKDYSKFLAEARTVSLLTHDPQALAVTNASERGLTRGPKSMFENRLEAQKELYAQGLVPAYPLAATCSLLGRKRAALDYLRSAYEKHESLMLGLLVDSKLRNLHDEPAYKELLRQVGLRN